MKKEFKIKKVDELAYKLYCDFHKTKNHAGVCVNLNFFVSYFKNNKESKKDNKFYKEAKKILKNK